MISVGASAAAQQPNLSVILETSSIGEKSIYKTLTATRRVYYQNHVPLFHI